MKRILLCLISLAMVAAFLGCPKPQTRQTQGEMDTPEHHVTMADRMIREREDWKGAHAEYQLALTLKPDFSPALIGEAVYYAHEKNAQKAEEFRDAAWKNAKGDPKKEMGYYIGVIQINTYLKGDKWLERAEEAFKKASEIDANNEKLSFFMAKAYLADLDFDKSESLLKKVVGMNGNFREDADQLWSKVQKIVRARPGSFAAKKIALVDKITKADVAALFVEEMHLPELWRKRGIKKWEPPAFQTPDEAARAAAQQAGPNVTDIAGHPLQSDIQEVLKLGIRGLEVDPSGKFYPNKPVTRAEYAVMLEDILIKVLNEPGLASKYAGESDSKFHDMRTDHWSYNAAVVVTSRGMLPPDMEGNFKPMDPVSGADALLVIRQMMDYLKIG